MGEKLERSDPSLLITVFDNFVQNSLHKATNSFASREACLTFAFTNSVLRYKGYTEILNSR